MGSPMPDSPAPFGSLVEALDGSRSRCFGILADGQPKHAESYYGTDTPHLCFDVSNYQVLCTITSTGLLENACICDGLIPAGLSNRYLPGIYVYKELIGGGPWPLGIRRKGGEPMMLHELPGVGAELLGNLFPLFAYRDDDLSLRLLTFAPMSAGETRVAPRAIVVVLHIKNEGEQPFEGALVGPSDPPEVSRISGGSGMPSAYQAVACLDGTGWDSERRELAFALQPGEGIAVSLAFLLGRGAKELRRTERALRARTALEWLNETWGFHAERLGRLSIPDAPFYAEGLARFEELCRQSVMRMADGKFGAGFWGSNFVGASAWESACVWTKDNFHAMLPMSMFEPQLCADAILFYLRWGLPTGPYGQHGGGSTRFPNPRRVTHSLANALAPLVLASAYYQMTGDRAFFVDHPEILDGAKALLGDVLQSRQGEPFLFPSMFISDGPARGDYHTGSNLLVWYSFQHMARIAREVYDEQELADTWSECAASVKDAILQHCVGDCSLGRRFFEGANADGTLVACHDGEETDTTLMPFYGFCEADDPALINHARLGLSPGNPYYAPGVDGIWWEEAATTFPGWMTALASASNEDEVRDRLEQIRRLTDHDGSIWWWPHRYGCTDPTEVRRREPYFTFEGRDGLEDLGVGKCGWAAGVYLCLFVNTILGVRVDVPARRVSLRPFCPWPEFTWERCRVGHSTFDFAYEHQNGYMVARITNHSESAFEGLIELTLPVGATLTACTTSGAEAEQVEHTERYGRPAVRVACTMRPGGTLRLESRYAGDGCAQ